MSVLVTLPSPDAVEAWRAAAKSLRADGVAPERVAWRLEGDPGDLLAEPYAPRKVAATAPKRFAELASRMLLHGDPGRFALAYRLFWRLPAEPRLMERAADPEVAEALRLEKAVRRDMHKMRAFVRFREMALPEGPAFAAWFEPDHHIVEANAPFFVRRFAAMRWTIVTPRRTAVWDGESLSFAPGGRREDAPAEDAMEAAWRRYYGAIFNPARLKPAAMRAEMPKKYWRNLPEAQAIPTLMRQAPARTAEMVAAMPALPDPEDAEMDLLDGADPARPDTLEALADAEAGCRRCPLWEPATQAVPGAGRPGARLMFVGEQPGDKEDLAGRPFVGPAGRLFDQALEEAGIDRDDAFVTNAVKHFKFEQRGKFRLHKSPSTGEISQCRWWLEQERRLVKPKLLVALGASAAQGLLGRRPTICKVRGAAIEGPEGAPVFVTVHPSYLLRLPDEDAKAREYGRFVEDLRECGRLAA